MKLEVTQLHRVGLQVSATAGLVLHLPGSVPPVGSADLIGVDAGAWRAISIGDGLTLAGGVLDVAGGGTGYTLLPATTKALGGVTIGANITVADGQISITETNVTAALGLTPVDATGAASAAPVQSVAGATGAVALPYGMTVNFSQGAAPAVGVITLDGYVDSGVTITALDHCVGTAGGTVEAKLEIVSKGSTTAIGGLSAVTLNASTVTSVSATSANKAITGDRLQLNITKVTGAPAGAFLRVRGTRP